MKVYSKYEPRRSDYETEEEYEQAMIAFEYAWSMAELAASGN